MSTFFTNHGLESFRFVFYCDPAFSRERVRYPRFDSVPLNIRYAYFQHRVKRQGAKRSLFAHLFIPVYEAELKRLGISEQDHAVRRKELGTWISWCMHEYWKESWVVAHATSADGAKHLPHYDGYTVDDDPETRVENDCKFLRICCAIDVEDENTILELFAGFRSSVDDLNYCFGTTLLGFATCTGRQNALRLLLRSVKDMKQKQLYTYLSIAVLESQRKDIIDILLNHCTQHMKDKAGGNAFLRKDVARRILVQDLFIAATTKGNQRVFNAVYEWMESIPNFYGKRSIFEGFFARTLKDKTFGKFLPPLNTLSTSSNRALGTLAIIPAHHFGVAYQRRVQRKFTHVVRDEGWIYVCSRGSKRTYAALWTVSRVSILNRSMFMSMFMSSPLFVAVKNGWLDWVDRLLYAGADPGLEEGGVGLLDLALKGQWGRENVRRRKEVAQLMYAHDWRYRDWKWVRCGDAQV